MLRGISCYAYYKCSNCDRKYSKIIDTDRSLNYCIRCHAPNYPYDKVILKIDSINILKSFSLCHDIISCRSTSSGRKFGYTFQIGAIENISEYHSNQKCKI